MASPCLPPPESTGPYVVPPPAGCPTKDNQSYTQNPVPVERKSRGCCAALCCRCVLDACF